MPDSCSIATALFDVIINTQELDVLLDHHIRQSAKHRSADTKYQHAHSHLPTHCHCGRERRSGREVLLAMDWEEILPKEILGSSPSSHDSISAEVEVRSMSFPSHLL